MEQRLSLITLGVADLDRARTFYERLGWRGQQVEETVFFQAGALAVVLWGRARLAEDAGLTGTAVDDAGVSGTAVDGTGPSGGTDGFGGIALAHNVRSRAGVDDVLAEAEAAGARVTQPARETFYGGYAGSFTDPDGHVWEIAYNPGFTLDDAGGLTIPDMTPR